MYLNVLEHPADITVNVAKTCFYTAHVPDAT